MLSKLAVVTGASRGIGKAAAINFARLGFDVVLIAKNVTLLQQCAAEIKNQYPAINTLVFDLDVANQAAVENCIKQITQKYSNINILFNNAGILFTGLLDIPDEQIKAQIETNIVGSYNMLKAVAPIMKAQKSGYIFNMASRSGKIAIPKFGAYSATKFALIGINEALHEEMLPYDVKVTALCPSVIDTDMTKDFNIPNEDKIEVQDIINTINYLLTLSPNALVKELCIKCKYVMLNPIDASK